MATNIFINGSATITEAEVEINVAEVYFIANDNITSGDLHISFETSLADTTNYMIIKPGEKFEEMGFPCKKFYVKSSIGTVSYRVYGSK